MCVCVNRKQGGQYSDRIKTKARSHITFLSGLNAFLSAWSSCGPTSPLTPLPSLEFIWANLPSSTTLFTNVLFYRYEGPDGFCFDTNCADPPLVTNPQSPEYNVLERVRVLMEYLDEQVI